MSAVDSSTASANQATQYQYNKLGNIRARLQGDGLKEVLLDVKLVQQSNASVDYLATVGGAAAEARNAGFILSFQSAQELGVEILNEATGQWRAVPSGASAIVASLPE